MAWKKSPEELVALFLELTRELEGIEPRKMFGYPCCFVNGNMFTGLHQENWVVRLDEETREKLLKKGWKQFEPMKGRVMKQYLSLPEATLKKKAEIKKMLLKSLEYAGSLPPKKKKR